MPSSLSVLPATLLSSFPHRFQVLQTHLLYSHEHVTGLLPPHSLPLKGLKILDLSIHLSCHFSEKTHHKDTLPQELGILIHFARPISKYDIQSQPFPQNSHPTLKYCSNVICLSIHERGSSQIRYGINNSLFQATIKNRWTHIYKNLVISLRSHY